MVPLMENGIKLLLCERLTNWKKDRTKPGRTSKNDLDNSLAHFLITKNTFFVFFNKREKLLKKKPLSRYDSYFRAQRVKGTIFVTQILFCYFYQFTYSFALECLA